MTVSASPLPIYRAQHAETDSARRAGGPQDRAHYECGCGEHFTAAVSTDVDCPRCGCDQAW